MRTNSVCYAEERDALLWQRRHAQGEVPSRWPYGLDALPDRDQLRSLAPTPRLRQAAGWLGSALPRQKCGRTELVWDENVALRLMPHRGVQRFAGVIWLTDKPLSWSTLRQRMWLSRFDGLWVLSPAQVDPLLRALGPRPPKIGYVPFGIDADFYSYRRYPSAPLVFSVGGDRDRDARTLFEALRVIRAEMPEAQVVVQTTSDLKPPDGVRVERYFTHLELRELYSAASVITIATLPNLHVSGMTVALEAMATGRPVVITESPGMKEYVVHGETGVLVAQRDAAALARSTLALLRDPIRAERMGRAGRVKVEKQHTCASMCAAIARLCGE